VPVSSSRRSRSSRSSRSSTVAAPRGLLLPAIALVVVAGLALAAWTGGGEEPEPPTDTTADQAETADELDELLASLERREEGDPLALGDVDAPVLMIEWADFQCPFCGGLRSGHQAGADRPLRRRGTAAHRVARLPHAR
jgi:protein-disulfide isomerase